MQRREFVRSALATAGAATGVAAFGAETAPGERPRQEYYQLRAYALRTGPQLALTQGYFERALIPALNRLGMSPVGTFKLDIGPETPTYYVLIPSTSVETLLSLDTLLGKDPEYVKGASGFRDAPASAPAFVRAERSILSAFSGWPKLAAPKLEARIFQLRTYESPSQVAHTRKIQMFNEAEIGLFTNSDSSLGSVRGRSGVEGTLAQAWQYRCRDRKQHYEPVPQPAKLLTDLKFLTLRHP
jgi:hypothetical protein